MGKNLSPQEIERQATDFLHRHHPEMTLPIPIEEIIEFKLGLHIIPAPDLIKKTGVDALTCEGFTQLYIDQGQLKKNLRRARFTLAHEVAHLILHQSLAPKQSSVDESLWRQFVLNDRQQQSLERQANLFAALILMPGPLLRQQFQIKKSELLERRRKRAQKTKADLTQSVIRALARQFQVSEESMSHRYRQIQQSEGWI